MKPTNTIDLSPPAKTTLSVLPCSDFLIVRRRAADEKIGSIVIPDVAREKPQTGIILAAGTAIQDGRIAPGAWVLFFGYSGHEMDVGGETVLVLREEEIIGIVVQ